MNWIPRPPSAVESSSLSHLEHHAPSVPLCGRLLCSWCFRMLCISNFGVRNWPLVLVPGVNPFGRPELRCSGQCGDLNPLNPTRSTQCPAQNPKSSCISSVLASLAHLLLDIARSHCRRHLLFYLVAATARRSQRSSRPCASSLISALAVDVDRRPLGEG